MIHVYKYAEPTRKDFDDYDQLRKNYECKHLNYVLTKLIARNGVIQYKWQCDRCGKKTGAISYTKLSESEISSAIEADETLSYAYNKQMRELAQGHERDFNAAWWRWYNQYLESCVWKERRAKVIYRAKGVCEACGEARPTEVHHLTYNHVGSEPLFDLVAVCHECHDQLTAWGRG